MYNLDIPLQLKNWINASASADVTFRYTGAGPENLLTGKKVYIGLACSGLYRDTEKDAQALT